MTTCWWPSIIKHHGPLARYVKLWVAHAPGMLGTFSPPPRVSDPNMHHGTCVTHVSWRMPGSLTSGFFWSRWRGKRSRHSRSMRNSQFTYLARDPWHHLQDSDDRDHVRLPFIIYTDTWMDKAQGNNQAAGTSYSYLQVMKLFIFCFYIL